MKDEKDLLPLQDPMLPETFRNARRNHGGMTVPDDFFSQFERKMNAVIDAEVQTQVSKPQLQLKPAASVWNLGRWLSVAASVALIVGISIMVNRQQKGETLSDSVQLAAAAAPDASAEAVDPVAEEMMACATDFDVFDLYCDL